MKTDPIVRKGYVDDAQGLNLGFIFCVHPECRTEIGRNEYNHT